ncbi:MAG: DUF2461 domain-containing protein [Saprospiraceae bacterium]|nr:DUF2461 domain-containing protein [Saprospiraceae bacterium]
MLTNDTIQFFREMRENNHKEWFDVNRKRYEKVKLNYYSLTEEILTEMKAIDESLDMVQTKDCVFRINRDIRFSKDKTPYKTFLGINLAPFGKKMMLAGYYTHLDEGQSFTGGGLYMPMAPELKKVRREIHYCWDEFQAIINQKEFVKTFGTLDNNPELILSRPPKDYSPDDPAIEYLKYKSFTAVQKIDDKLLNSASLKEYILESFVVIKPFIQFLNRALLSDENGNQITP